MGSLTSFVLRHKRLVMLGWLVLVLVGFATLGSTTKRLSTEFKLPGQPAYVADAKINALYHTPTGAVPLVVTVTSPAGSRVDPVRADKVLTAAAAAVPNSQMADQLNTGDGAFTTKSGTTTFGLIFAPEKPGPGDTVTTPITDAARAAAPAGYQTGVTGLQQLQSGGGSHKGTGVFAETFLGGLGSLVVLAFVFASFIAVVPLLMAVIAIPTTFLAVGGLTHLTSVSIITEFLIALIGLGVAIDYSLLIVTRWREERAHGYDNHEAVTRAMNSAGRAVVFSGLTVAVSLLALVVLPVSFLATIGIAGFLIPIISVAVALTLLPALLATAGPFLDRPRFRREVHASRPWTAWARLVLRHRKKGAFLGAAILIALIIPVFAINLGEPKTSALAQKGTAHTTLVNLHSGGVPTGVIEPIDVLVEQPAAASVVRQLSQVKGVYTAFESNAPAFHQAGTTIVEVLPGGESSTPSGASTISAVRSEASRLPGVIGVGGAGPEQADFVHAVYGSFPLMLALIGLATLLLLTRAFRSIVLAAKAVIFNIMSVAAAYGIMVLVWQEGHGSGLLGSVPATGSITVWIPIMVFAFLFGLSMDYEVFILSRIREEYDRTGSTDEAVVVGIGRTGRLVTSAALILFLGFVSLSTAGMTDLKVLATGLGAGILLDAFLVRSLLVPSLVGVLGRWNWYLPGWMATVLRVRPPAPLTAPPDDRVLVGAGAEA